MQMKALRWNEFLMILIMKRLYLILIFITTSLIASSKEYKVYGPQGGLAMEVTLPDGFNEDTDNCPWSS